MTYSAKAAFRPPVSPPRSPRAAAAPLLAVAAAAALLLAPSPAAADEVEEALQSALAAWQAGDAALAKSEAEYALAKIAEADAGGLAAFLPPALPGWTRSEAQSQAAGAFAGGALIATADYAGPGGEQVGVMIAADGPIFMAMSAMFSNPAAMASMGTLTRLGPHRAVVSPDGEITAMIGRSALVQITGGAPDEVKLAHLQTMDLDGLAAR
ncbi:MAG: hypothetical protein AAF763_14765 [Pseudomonadota bacterium]